MALYTVAAGNTIQIADLNQVVNLLTGATQGLVTTLGGGIALNNATSNLIDFGAVGVQTPNTGPLTSAGTKVNWYDAGTGTPNVYATGITTGELWDNVPLGESRTFYVAGGKVAAINGGSITHSGQIIGHGAYACIEAGDGTARHIERTIDTSSHTGVATNNSVSVTLTFARAFAGTTPPSIAAIGAITGAFQLIGVSLVAFGGSAGAWTSVTVDFWNRDSSSQTLSYLSVTAFGE